MRVLVVNVCVLLIALTVINAQRNGGINTNRQGAQAQTVNKAVARTGHFLDTANNGVEFLSLMKKNLDMSMNYLLTSKQYGSQYVQRPGMAKLLSESSDRHWEEGFDLLKKFLQRGGHIDDVGFNNAFAVSGLAGLKLDANEDTNTKYVETLNNMLSDSKVLTQNMNNLHHLASKNHNHQHDAEISHYFDDKLDKEAEITRELAGHINELQQMNKLGVALKIFDSSL